MILVNKSKLCYLLIILIHWISHGVCSAGEYPDAFIPSEWHTRILLSLSVISDEIVFFYIPLCSLNIIKIQMSGF